MTASDTAYHRLHCSGWSIVDTALSKPPGLFWCAYGRNGENFIRSEGRTRDKVDKEAEGSRGGTAQSAVGQTS